MFSAGAAGVHGNGCDIFNPRSSSRKDYKERVEAAVLLNYDLEFICIFFRKLLFPFEEMMYLSVQSVGGFKLSLYFTVYK